LLIYKGFSIPGDLFLITSVLLNLLYFSILLMFHPIRKLLKTYENAESGTGKTYQISESDLASLNKIYRAAGFFLKHLWRTDRPCLRRTLILHNWCKNKGIPSLVIIGVRKTDDDLESHAWLELAGKPFRESPDLFRPYAPIWQGQ
jgi:hypothetical protein